MTSPHTDPTTSFAPINPTTLGHESPGEITLPPAMPEGFDALPLYDQIALSTAASQLNQAVDKGDIGMGAEARAAADKILATNGLDPAVMKDILPLFKSSQESSQPEWFKKLDPETRSRITATIQLYAAWSKLGDRSGRLEDRQKVNKVQNELHEQIDAVGLDYEALAPTLVEMIRRARNALQTSSSTPPPKLENPAESPVTFNVDEGPNAEPVDADVVANDDVLHVGDIRAFSDEDILKIGRMSPKEFTARLTSEARTEADRRLDDIHRDLAIKSEDIENGWPVSNTWEELNQTDVSRILTPRARRIAKYRYDLEQGKNPRLAFLKLAVLTSPFNADPYKRYEVAGPLASEADQKLGRLMGRVKQWKDNLLNARSLAGGQLLSIAWDAMKGVGKIGNTAYEKFSVEDPNDPNKRKLTFAGKSILIGAAAVMAAGTFLLKSDAPQGGGHTAGQLPDFNDVYPHTHHTGIGLSPDQISAGGSNVYDTPGIDSTTDAPHHGELNDAQPHTTSEAPAAPADTQSQPGSSAPSPADTDAAPATPDTAGAQPPHTTITVEAGDTVYGIGHEHGLNNTQIANGINDGSVKIFDHNHNPVTNINHIEPGYTVEFTPDATPVTAPATPADVPAAQQGGTQTPGVAEVHSAAPPPDAISFKQGDNLGGSVQDWLQHNGRGGANLHDATEAFMNYNQNMGINLNWDTARQLQATNLGDNAVATLYGTPIHTPPQAIFDQLMAQAEKLKDVEASN
jgi:LysM repeat protein